MGVFLGATRQIWKSFFITKKKQKLFSLLNGKHIHSKKDGQIF